MTLFLPNNEKKLLLHCCCAPCSGSIIDLLLQEQLVPTLFFYNPNIHPFEEYEKRKKELSQYALKRGVAFIDADYEVEAWFKAVRGLEEEPERGKRCSVCFDMRLKKTASYASFHGFKVIATTLGISRWKNFAQVTEAGKKAVSNDLFYFDYNWRKGNAQDVSKKISIEENFYRQTYCGCLFSRENKGSFVSIS